MTVPAPFGNRDVSGLELFGLDLPVGRLTGFAAHPTGESKGVALFVPGWTGSKEDFHLLLPALAALGWTAVAYSQRGQADSAAPVGIENFSLDLLAADAVLVARQVAERFAAALARTEQPAARLHLVGHSLGGLVAREAAILAPDLFADVTLFCSGPGGLGEGGLDARESNRNRDLVAKKGLMALWKRQHPRGSKTDEDAFHEFRFSQSSPDKYLAGDLILRWTPDSTPALKATGLPVLVTHGDADDAWPQAMQRDMANRLGARYEVVPAAGHSPNLDNPIASAALLDDFFTARGTGTGENSAE